MLLQTEALKLLLSQRLLQIAAPLVILSVVSFIILGTRVAVQ